MAESNANSRVLVPELSVEENDIIRAWITLNIIPGKEPLNECRNSDFNGALCKRTGIKLSNEQFKVYPYRDWLSLSYKRFGMNFTHQ